MHHVYPAPGNPRTTTILVYEYLNYKPRYESIEFKHVVMTSFCSLKLSSDWMGLFFNELMTYYCNGLDKYEASSL